MLFINNLANLSVQVSMKGEEGRIADEDKFKTTFVEKSVAEISF